MRSSIHWDFAYHHSIALESTPPILAWWRSPGREYDRRSFWWHRCWRWGFLYIAAPPLALPQSLDLATMEHIIPCLWQILQTARTLQYLQITDRLRLPRWTDKISDPGNMSCDDSSNACGATAHEQMPPHARSGRPRQPRGSCI